MSIQSYVFSQFTLSCFLFFFSSRRRHTRSYGDWSSDVCSSDLDEVDDLEHRRQTGGEFGAAGDLEGGALLGEGPLGPDDALGDGRLRDEERPRDLLGRQTAEQAECERNARLGREHRMTRYEHEAQEVVANVGVDRGVEIRRGHLLLGLDLAPELLVLALEQLAST